MQEKNISGSWLLKCIFNSRDLGFYQLQFKHLQGRQDFEGIVLEVRKRDPNNPQWFNGGGRGALIQKATSMGRNSAYCNIHAKGEEAA